MEEKEDGKLINGRRISQQIKDDLKRQVDALANMGIIPGLAVVLIGDDPASHTYVKSKEKAAEYLGVKENTYHLKADKFYLTSYHFLLVYR